MGLKPHPKGRIKGGSNLRSLDWKSKLKQIVFLNYLSNALLDHFGRVAGNTSGSKSLIISVIRSYLEHWVQRVIMAHLLYLHQRFVCYLRYDKRMILLLLVYSYVAKKKILFNSIYFICSYTWPDYITSSAYQAFSGHRWEENKDTVWNKQLKLLIFKEHVSWFHLQLACENPMGTWCQNDVVLTSMSRVFISDIGFNRLNGSIKLPKFSAS